MRRNQTNLNSKNQLRDDRDLMEVTTEKDGIINSKTKAKEDESKGLTLPKEEKGEVKHLSNDTGHNLESILVFGTDQSWWDFSTSILSSGKKLTSALRAFLQTSCSTPSLIEIVPSMVTK